MARGGWIGDLVEEELVPAEAGVTLPTVRVEDPEHRPAPRRAVAVPGDQRFGALADDVAPEMDPRAPGQLQAEAGRFGDGTGQAAGQTGRLQHDEQRLRSSGQRGETTEPVGDDRRPIRGGKATTGQVEDEQVHRAPGEQCPADGQALFERVGGDDHQPFEANTPGDGLDRVEAPGQIQPGHDGTRGLGFSGEPQDERGPAAGAVPADGDTRRARKPTVSQDGVEGGEPGPNDPLVWVRGSDRPWVRSRCRFGRCRQARHGRQGQGAVRGAFPAVRGAFRDPRSCRTPASLEARHGCRHVRGECRHSFKIEHLFYRIKSTDSLLGISCRLAHQSRFRRLHGVEPTGISRVPWRS